MGESGLCSSCSWPTCCLWCGNSSWTWSSAGATGRSNAGAGATGCNSADATGWSSASAGATGWSSAGATGWSSAGAGDTGWSSAGARSRLRFLSHLCQLHSWMFCP